MSPMDKPRTAAVNGYAKLFPKLTCNSEICSRQFPGLSKMRGLVKGCDVVTDCMTADWLLCYISGHSETTVLSNLHARNLQWLQSASNFGLELVLLVWHMSLSSVWRAAEIHFHVVVGFVRLPVGVYCKSLELNSCLKLWMLLSHLLLFYICSSYLHACVPGSTKVAGIRPSAPAWRIYIISCCTWVESSSATW